MIKVIPVVVETAGKPGLNDEAHKLGMFGQNPDDYFDQSQHAGLTMRVRTRKRKTKTRFSFEGLTFAEY